MTELIGAPTVDDALTALQEKVKTYEARGERTLVFCEDRLTLLAERAVLAATGGTFLTEVSTFRRFLSERPAARLLSKQGSVMAIEALLLEHEEELGCFKKNAAQAVYETLAQLSASRVDAALLAKCADEAEGLLRLKLKDLSFLLEKYNDFLHEGGYLDENGYLALLPSRLGEEEVGNINLIFFAFPSFTRQAREGVRAAASSARSVTGIFLGGEEDFYTNEAERSFREAAEECGMVKTKHIPCSLTGEAERLRRALFSAEGRGAAVPATSIFSFSAADETEEMNTVAALIRKHVAEGKRYRDIAVLLGGEEYRLAAVKAFDAYGIPYSADEKRKFSDHPFCAFVLDVLDAVADGVLPAEADRIASSVYFGDGDRYRNYLLKFGQYRGAVRREIKEGDAVRGYDRDELVACRRKMRGILALFKDKGYGKAFTDGIRELYRFVGGKDVTEALAKRLEEERAFLEADRLFPLLDEVDAVVGGTRFTVREFATLLRSGLEALSVSLLPRRADAVFLGDVTESKIARADILFAVGLTDGLPRVAQDTAVITDGEIDRMKSLSVEVEPAIAVVNARARESFALNLCSFSERLYLSYPAKKGGKEAERSEAFFYLESALIPEKRPDLFPYDCSRPAPAALAFFSEREGALAARERGASSSLARDASIREALLRMGEADPARLLSAAEKGDVPEAGQLYFSKEISPTLLEDYFSCPYKGFAARALRVTEREERGVLDSTDAGTFVHTVLEQIARRFNDLPSEEAAAAAAREEANSLLTTSRFSALLDTGAGSYAGERIVGEAVAAATAAYLQLAGSSYRVRETEEGVSLPELSLRGTADRVDVFGDMVRVIDYKTGSIDDSAAAYYTGRKLQLELYLKAASRGGVSAGAFYFPAADDFRSEDGPRFRMRGFYRSDPEVVAGMDVRLGEGGTSDFFEGGARSEKGMPREDFEDFLDYSVLVSEGAEREMRAGNVTPSPYAGVCDYCKYKGMCGFVGEPRKESDVRFSSVVRIVRAEKEKR